MKKDKKSYSYNNIICDSQGEVEFLMWCEELKQNGYIIDYKRGETKLLSNSVYNTYTAQLKTKTKEQSETILLKHEYSWDFTIEWSDLGIKYFANRFGEKWTKPFLINSKSMSFIENKPSFDFGNMTRLVTLNVKWMWEKYGIFIQVVKNDDLFKETFVPKERLFNKKGEKRAFKFKPLTLEEYINKIKLL